MSYLLSEDQPFTVDPVTRDRWITPGAEDKHHFSVQRGEELDAKAMLKSIEWFKSHQGEIPFFSPNTRMLDVASKWPIPQSRGCLFDMHGNRRDPTRFGRLPTIAQFRYDGALQDKARGDIEHEMREADRRMAGRVFDTDGYTR